MDIRHTPVLLTMCQVAREPTCTVRDHRKGCCSTIRDNQGAGRQQAWLTSGCCGYGCSDCLPACCCMQALQAVCRADGSAAAAVAVDAAALEGLTAGHMPLAAASASVRMPSLPCATAAQLGLQGQCAHNLIKNQSLQSPSNKTARVPGMLPQPPVYRCHPCAAPLLPPGSCCWLSSSCCQLSAQTPPRHHRLRYAPASQGKDTHHLSQGVSGQHQQAAGPEDSAGTACRDTLYPCISGGAVVEARYSHVCKQCRSVSWLYSHQAGAAGVLPCVEDAGSGGTAAHKASHIEHATSSTQAHRLSTLLLLSSSLLMSSG